MTRVASIITGLLIFVFSAGQLSAQTVWTEPELPTATEEVTIYFDATDTSLEDYSGDVYTHTGVNLESDNWQYVIGEWGDNDSQPQLESLGNNQYKLEITPDIYTFYGASQSQTITGLAFVFRSADASTQTGDLFVDVFESGLTVSFIQPETPPMVLENESIAVEIGANQSDSVLLKVSDEIVKRVAGTTLEHSFAATGTNGKNWMVAIAKDADNTVYDSTYFRIRDEVVIESVPQGMKKGINYNSDTGVTLVFQAPYKEFVFVLGDFNNWQIDTDYYMKLDPDGEHFWLEIDGLNPGEEYVFQYFIDGELRIADPYTEQTSDPWHDNYIPESIYPNLISYPDNENAEGLAAVLQTAQNPYEWEVEDFEAPKKEDLVIYELLIRDFVEENSYATITDTLDYLKELGINVLELMPVTEFEGNSSWGYNPSFYFAPDKAYGPKNELKRLIDEAHKRGIAVFFDLVLNHSYGQSPLVQMYFEDGAPAENNPWYNRECPHPPSCWGYDFDHESQYTRDFIDDVNTYWIDHYKIDGYRFDFTRGFTNNGNYDHDEDRIAIIKRMADKIWEKDPDTYVTLEHWADNSEEEILINYNDRMLVWSNVTHNYQEGAMGWNEDGKSDFSWASYKTRGWDVPGAVVYMESHDEERMMYKMQEWGNQDNPDHDVKELGRGLERAGMATAFLFAIPGPKMIWQFGELGYDVSIDYDCRVCPKPVLWDYYDDWRRKFLYDVYGALIDLKLGYDVFETSNFTIDVWGALKKVRLDGDEMDVVIVGNFDVFEGEIEPDFHQSGTWYDYFTGEPLEVEDVNAPLSLNPGEYHIYTSGQIEPANLYLDVDEINTKEFGAAIHPNPSSDEFTIRINTKDRVQVKAKVYTVFGEQVASLYAGELSVGTQDFKWKPPAETAPGVYVLRIETPETTITKKLLYR